MPGKSIPHPQWENIHFYAKTAKIGIYQISEDAGKWEVSFFIGGGLARYMCTGGQFSNRQILLWQFYY